MSSAFFTLTFCKYNTMTSFLCTTGYNYRYRGGFTEIAQKKTLRIIHHHYLVPCKQRYIDQKMRLMCVRCTIRSCTGNSHHNHRDELCVLCSTYTTQLTPHKILCVVYMFSRYLS